MKLYINHTYTYQSQHISMLFFSRVDILDIKEIGEDAVYITSEITPVNGDVIISARVVERGQTFGDETMRVEAGDDKAIKYAISLTLFKILSKYTGKRPSWGILTGVRPTKRYHALKYQGMSKAQIRTYFETHDLVTPEKVDLLEQVSAHSYAHIFPMDDTKISLYVGIAFCPSKCVYCSFTTNIKDKGDDVIEQYVGAVIRDIKLHAARYKDKSIQTVYFGGGTPSMLTGEQIKRIDDALRCHYNMNDLEEYTFEAGRPELIDDALLCALKAIGVTRICINPQTMHDHTLKAIGRTHDVAEIRRAFACAARYDFIVNADVIVGLVGETVEESASSLSEIIELSPENITLHTLSLKRGSILHHRLDDYEVMPENDVRRAVTLGHQMLLDAGYVPYYMYRQKYISGNLENVGYTKKGCESIYNIQMIEERQTVVAFGAGTTSKFYNFDDDILTRQHTTKNISEYMK